MMEIPGLPAPGKEPLQVRIPTEVKRRFKSYAAMRGLEPHELFVEVWEHYEKTRIQVRDSNGSDQQDERGPRP